MDIEKKQKPKKVDLKKLPPALKEKYKAMGLLPEEKTKKNAMDVNLEQIKKRKMEKEKSIEEKLEEIQITQTENKALDRLVLRVFKLLCAQTSLEQSKDSKESVKQSFNARDVAKILTEMELNFTKSEIDLMLWVKISIPQFQLFQEVDENLDGSVDWKEFLNMYKKCTRDRTGLEPKSLFHLVQFLMYNNNREKFRITVEDTLELLYVRFGRTNLDSEIHAIFGDEEKTINGEEKEISFKEYLERINERAINERKKKKEQQKEKYSFKKQDDEQF